MTEPSFNLHWIPLFPLLGAVVNLLFGGLFVRVLGERLGKEIVHLVAIGAVAFSCFFTFSLVQDQLVSAGFERLVQQVYPWIVSGDTLVGFDLMLDHLSAVMCMVITGVGLLIHIFSVGYMARDPGYHRYFAYLNLFMAAMLVLVLGKSLVLLFVGWEGVGLCSYLLIGFWFTDEDKATAGRKAFIVNRIGDLGVILGMLLLYAMVGSLDFDAIRSVCAAAENSPLVTTTIFGASVATVASACLFLGCTGKSAQIPLYVWLPDAMAGPTPVSALIHAATMVTAGVYLVVRLNFLFALAPAVLAVIAVVGALTAFFAATIGLAQNDIKKVLAYSTVSQLGYMFVAVGMGAWVAAIFHLVTHAFFKACLFLGSGAVIEACHHHQDIRTMGGLRKKMPYTAATFLVSCLAIAGVPPLSGFFSKDEILLRAYTNFSHGSPALNYVVYALGLAAAACTAFYMFRLYMLVFEGKFRGDHHTWTHYVREHWIMTGPLVVLAVLAAFAGLLGYPHVFPHLPRLPGGGHLPHVLEEWLAPITGLSARFGGPYTLGTRAGWFRGADYHVTAAAEVALMVPSVVVGLAGIALAVWLYREGPSRDVARWVKLPVVRVLHVWVVGKYFVDEAYARLVAFVRFVGGVCYHVVDALLVDGLGVSGTSGAVGVIGNAMRAWHNGNVRRYLVVLLLGLGMVLGMIYFNPRIAKFGPTPLNSMDLGGLRPTLGAQRVRVKLLGSIEFVVGPEPQGGAGDR